MRTLTVAFATAVKRLRQSQTHLSQEKFAARADLSRVFYWQIENGKTAVGLETIHKIAIGFGMGMGELFSFVDEELGKVNQSEPKTIKPKSTSSAKSAAVSTTKRSTKKRG